MNLSDIKKCEVVCEGLDLGCVRLILDPSSSDLSVEKEIKIESPLFIKKGCPNDMLHFFWKDHLIMADCSIIGEVCFYLLQQYGDTSKDEYEIVFNIPEWLKKECVSNSSLDSSFIGVDFIKKTPSDAEKKGLFISKVCCASNMDEYNNPSKMNLRNRLLFYLANKSKYGEIILNDNTERGFFFQKSNRKIAEYLNCAESSVRRNLELLEFDSGDIEGFRIKDNPNVPSIYKIIC